MRWDPALVLKFPLIKCLIKNKIDLDMRAEYIMTLFISKLFNFIERRMMFKFPPSPWAPPKYSFLWKRKTSRKLSGKTYFWGYFYSYFKSIFILFDSS